MKVFQTNNNINFFLEVVPRFYYVENLQVIIREPIENVTTIVETDATIENGLLSIDLKDFIPENEVRYSLIIKVEELILWTGQGLYTTKDRQDYSMNNSDENKLRF